MTNFITINEREFNTNAIFDFAIVSDDETGENVLEVNLTDGDDPYIFTGDEADTIYQMLMAEKAATQALYALFSQVAAAAAAKFQQTEGAQPQ